MANVKISSFPNASLPMGSGDVVTGLQSGVNVNFSQTQILTGQPAAVGNDIIVYGGYGTTTMGGAAKVYAGTSYGGGAGGNAIFRGGNTFNGAGTAGSVSVYGGNSISGDGGNAKVYAGGSFGGGTGGKLTLKGGDTFSGTGTAGSVLIFGGKSIVGGGGTPGYVVIAGGRTDSSSVNGSLISIYGGSVNSASYHGGHVYIRPGANNNAGGNQGNVYIGGIGPGLNSSTYIKGRGTGGQVYMGVDGGPAFFAYGTGQIHLLNTGGMTIYVNIPSSAAGISSGGLYTSSGVVKVKP